MPNQDQGPVPRIPVKVINAYQDALNAVQPTIPPAPAEAPPPETGIDWEALAKQQQADMDNFRKRQARRAEEAVSAEQERLLRLILPLADNLARALNHTTPADSGLRQGIELTQRELERLLAAEGVTRLETVGQQFDPACHEALGTVAAEAPANTIIEEVEAGYMLGEKLLRPAKVMVSA